MSRIQRNIILICILFLLIPIGVSLFYIFPMGDDYSYARMGQSKTLLELTIGEYTTWNGRFCSNLFVVCNPMQWHNLVMYRLIPMVHLMCMFCAILFVLKRFVNFHDRYSQVALSLFIVVFYVAGMPTIAEGLFWYTGSVTYWLGVCMFMCCVFLYHAHRRGEKYVVLPVLMCATSGMNEVLALWLLVATLALCVIKWSKYHMFLGGVAVVSFLIVYLAPGNTIRAAHFHEKHQLFYSIWMSLLQFFRFTMTWCLDLKLISCIALVAFLPITFKAQWISNYSVTQFILRLLAVYFALVFLAIFPAYWSTGIMGQHRTVNMAYLIFLGCTVVFLLYFKSTPIGLKLTKFNSSTVVLCSLFFLMLQGNLFKCIRSVISGDLNQFSSQMYERIQQIKSCKEDTLYLNPLKAIPPVVLNYEIEYDPRCWKNTCYTEFYNPRLNLSLAHKRFKE